MHTNILYTIRERGRNCAERSPPRTGLLNYSLLNAGDMVHVACNIEVRARVHPWNFGKRSGTCPCTHPASTQRSRKERMIRLGKRPVKRRDERRPTNGQQHADEHCWGLILSPNPTTLGRTSKQRASSLCCATRSRKMKNDPQQQTCAEFRVKQRREMLCSLLVFCSPLRDRVVCMQCMSSCVHDVCNCITASGQQTLWASRGSSSNI